MPRGAFIAFEGLDGAGISTQARLLHERLIESGIPCNRSAEPTSGPVGSLLRQYLGHRIEFDTFTVAALFAADRLDHLYNRTNGLEQRLAHGITEISERYLFSSLAYQGVSVDMDWLMNLNRRARIPDVVVFLEIDPQTSYERVSKRQTSDEIFESLAEMEKVALNFIVALKRFEKKAAIIRIQAGGTAQEVGDAVWKSVQQLEVIGREGLLPLWDRRPNRPEVVPTEGGTDQ